jgi:acyl-CoA synthetase (AMP-forming)/AMP-acid ligase II
VSPSEPSLVEFLDGHPYPDDAIAVQSDAGSLTLGELRARVDALAGTFRAAGLQPGQAVGNLVIPGPSAVIVMFAAWRAGAVYVPVNNRFTADEAAGLAAEAGLALLVGTPGDLAEQPAGTGTVSYEWETGKAAGDGSGRSVKIGVYALDVAVISRTSGTTGRPKAVLLRHRGTMDAIDASLATLRGRGGGSPPGAQSPSGTGAPSGAGAPSGTEAPSGQGRG